MLEIIMFERFHNYALTLPRYADDRRSSAILFYSDQRFTRIIIGNAYHLPLNLAGILVIYS